MYLRLLHTFYCETEESRGISHGDGGDEGRYGALEKRVYTCRRDRLVFFCLFVVVLDD